MARKKKLRVVWVIVALFGLDGEFITSDLRPAWSTRAAAKRALKDSKGSNGADKDYEVRKFVAT